MKCRGHVAGRRRSRCLCDSVQIHPTLKRRMSTKEETRVNPVGAQKLFLNSYKIHPQSDRNHRTRGWTIKEEIPLVLFPRVKREGGSCHGTLSLHCSSDSPVRSAFLHSGEELVSSAPALLPRGILPFLLILSKTSEPHPLNLPAAVKHPPKHAI